MHRGQAVSVVASCAVAVFVACTGAAYAAYDAPDPGGSETNPVAVPPRDGKFFGYNDQTYLNPLRGIDAQELTELALGAGANAGRFNLDWRYLERNQDIWDEAYWAKFEALYDALVAADMKPLVTIGAAPAWARDPGAAQACNVHQDCEYPPARNMIGEWQEFSAEVTERFPEAAIAIWNEPNIYQNWRYPDPERWASLVNSAYDAIKAVNPQAEVLAGGLAINQGTAHSDTHGDSIPLERFLRRAYAAPSSIKGHIDAIGLNANSKSLDHGAGSLFAEGMDDIRIVRAEFNDSGRPIWITEAWLSTSGTEGFSYEEQADGQLRLYRRALSMPDVKALFFHTLIDIVEAPFGSWDRGVGQTYISQSQTIVPKLSYCAFAGRVNTAVPALGCPKIDEQVDPPDPDPQASCGRAAKLKLRISQLRRKMRAAKRAERWDRYYSLRQRKDRALLSYRLERKACRAAGGV